MVSYGFLRFSIRKPKISVWSHVFSKPQIFEALVPEFQKKSLQWRKIPTLMVKQVVCLETLTGVLKKTSEGREDNFGVGDHLFNLGGGFIFYFHPYLGTWSNLTNIFRMGWNHQPVMYFSYTATRLSFGGWMCFGMLRRSPIAEHLESSTVYSIYVCTAHWAQFPTLSLQNCDGSPETTGQFKWYKGSAVVQFFLCIFMHS